MSNVPEEFQCTFPTWEYIYDLCRTVSEDVKQDSFEPDVVVALARGGWFAGRCTCDFLGLNDLTSLKVEHYVGTAERGDEATIRYPMPEGSVKDKDVFIIDDIAETGDSMRRAAEYIGDRETNEVRTALLQMLPDCEYEPDYVGEYMERWAWCVYPWNFIEDMIELIEGAMSRADQETFDVDDIWHRLYRDYGIERVSIEVAHPKRLPEVLTEMERRGIVSSISDEEWKLTA